MNRRKPITARQLAREKLLFRYSSALERGDFDTLAAILREAEADPALEKMLAEMDAVYRAELAPLPVLPTLSTNHNHRHTREDETMNVTYPTISRRLPDTRSRGRWNSAATLAAAMIALVLFAALLMARRPPTDPQQGNSGIAMQNETASPFALTPRPLMITATQFPTFTPTPLILHPIVSMTPTAVGGVIVEYGTVTSDNFQMIPSIVPIAAQAVSCTGTVYMLEAVNLLSQPNINGIVIGHIPGDTAVEVLIQQVQSDPSTNQEWYFVQVQNAEQAALGWMPSTMVAQTSACQNASNPCNITAVTSLPTFTPTWTPTPAPGLQVEPLDVTATPPLAEEMLLPTFVPPCGLPSSPTPPPYIPPNATPIAVFDLALRDGGYVLLTTEQVGDIPTNALVRINTAQYNGSEWLYEVIANDGGTRGQAHDWQLQYAPDFVPGAATPTAMFDGALGSGFYAAVTNQAVGNIPAGTQVQIGSAFYNGVEWYYNISDASGRENTARESQLDFAPDYAPGMATPTAAYFDLRGQVLVTLVQVGNIPANTPVQATSGYYDGNEWVYGIVTLDGNAFADARASQLRAVSLDEAGVQPSPIPATVPHTPPPTLTVTPIS